MIDSRFILGTVQFGLPYGINNNKGKPTKEVVFDILHFAHDNGIRQLDSADAYGDAQSLIGEFVESTNKVFKVNTKFHVEGEYSISEQLDKTLGQMRIPNVHTYFYHRLDDLVSKPGILSELLFLKQIGKIKKVGVSIYTNEDFQLVINSDEIDVIQLPFNLLDNYSKRGQLIEDAKKRHKELQIRSVFLQGLFFKEKHLPELLQPLSIYLDKLQLLARSYQISMFDLALGYVMANKEFDGVIIGIDTKEQLVQNLEASKTVLNPSLIREVNAIDVKEETLLYPYNWK